MGDVTVKRREILAVHDWPTNAELIADVHELGYLRDDDRILDPTYEGGVWWNVWRPQELVWRRRSDDGFDFRAMDYGDNEFDAIAYDPPYVCPGGRKTSTLPELHERYGMAEGGFEDPEFRTPEQLQLIVNAGLAECLRVVRPSAKRALCEHRCNGIVLCKAANYIWGGRYYEGATLTRNYAVSIGFEVEDQFEFIGGVGPQPQKNPDGSERRQVHARHNNSTLYVFRKPKTHAGARLF